MPQKLPIAQITGDAFTNVFCQLLTFVRVATVPFILTYLAGFLVGFIAGVTGNNAALAKPYTVYGMSGWLLQWFLTAMFAAAWHRFVLLGPQEARTKIGIDITQREINFFARALVLGLIVWLPYMFAHSGLAASLYLGNRYEFNWSIIALLLWPLYISLLIVRLFMVLPASAVERPIRFVEAWNITRGMTWRLVAISFLCALPFFLLMRLITSAAPELPKTLWMQSATEIVVLVIWYLQVAVAANAISLTYRWIIQAKQPSANLL